MKKITYDAVLVSGQPCSGRTTLVNNLKEAYGWPILTKHDCNLASENIIKFLEEGSIIADVAFSFRASVIPHCLRIFLYADFEDRIKRATFCNAGNKYLDKDRIVLESELRCMETESRRRARELDKLGGAYDYYESYDLMVNTSTHSQEQTFTLVNSELR